MVNTGRFVDAIKGAIEKYYEFYDLLKKHLQYTTDFEYNTICDRGMAQLG